jgi:hypothetical protein
LLSLLISSKPALWYVLITIGKFGFEREVVEKSTIDNIPIPSFEDLSQQNLGKIVPLFDAIVNENTEESWADVDTWVASLYGFQERDLQVIKDTLRLNLPFAENRKAAYSLPSTIDIDAFCSALEGELTPWTKPLNRSVRVLPAHFSATSPWGMVQIKLNRFSTDSAHTGIQADLRDLMGVGDQVAATEFIYPDPTKDCLWLGRLNQARYWSISQAHLTARRIVWEHTDLLIGP